VHYKKTINFRQSRQAVNKSDCTVGRKQKELWFGWRTGKTSEDKLRARAKSGQAGWNSKMFGLCRPLASYHFISQQPYLGQHFLSSLWWNVYCNTFYVCRARIPSSMTWRWFRTEITAYSTECNEKVVMNKVVRDIREFWCVERGWPLHSRGHQGALGMVLRSPRFYKICN
jgi:hypothetical protein